MHDAIIVGCGPSGNTLAWRLARRGFKTLMIEKAHLPRPKTCAGGLSLKTLQALPFPVDEVIERRVTGAWLTFRGESFLHKRMPGAGATVDRARLDQFMTGQAVAAGAELREGVEFKSFESSRDGVLVRTSAGECAGRFLIGADGAASRVRRRLHPNEHPPAALAIETDLFPPGDALEALGDNALFDFGALPGGYGWIFPKRDRFSVGLLRTRRAGDARNLSARLEEFISHYTAGGLEGREKPFKGLLSRGRIARARMWPIPVRPVARRVAAGRVLLVGDAAGFGEAFFGEGVFNAVRSAGLAYEALRGALEEGRPAEEYYNARAAGIRRELLFARLAARLFYAAPKFSYDHLVRNRQVNGLFSRMVTGRTSPIACFLATLFLCPLWAFDRGQKPA
jgi:geranylgeranyl reductase family protein